MHKDIKTLRELGVSRLMIQDFSLVAHYFIDRVFFVVPGKEVVESGVRCYSWTFVEFFFSRIHLRLVLSLQSLPAVSPTINI